ncbi:MAG: hypothetical protein L0216_17535 [Planctomycetales bacterium]|nr:hypothetical protein [Planctomycetales bacterium]
MDRGEPSPRSLGDTGAAGLARRRLLRLGAYLVPAILGTFAVTRTAEALSCLPQYCGPTPPCQPNTCQPDICQPFFCAP